MKPSIQLTRLALDPKSIVDCYSYHTTSDKHVHNHGVRLKKGFKLGVELPNSLVIYENEWTFKTDTQALHSINTAIQTLSSIDK